MDENSVINIFLPCDIIEHSRHALFGMVQTFCSYTIVNCVGSLSYDEPDFYEKTLKLDSTRLSIIGFINNVTQKHYLVNPPEKIACFCKDIYFLLYVDLESQKLSIEKIQMGGQNYDAKRIRITIYDAKDVLISRLISTVDETTDNEKMVVDERTNFNTFLKNATAAATKLPELCSLSCAKVSTEHLIYKVLCCFPTLFCRVVIFMALQYEHICTVAALRVPSFLSKGIQLSSVGRHIQGRLHHIYQITSSINKGKPLPLSCGNLISAIMLDVLCGWIFTYLFCHHCSSSFLLQIVMKYTNIVVSELQEILYWLMGVPAGLKLNLPLNTALGHFFLYHIYLWKTYMIFVKPIFAFVLDSMAMLGAFGLTFVICLLSDVFSMATIHIYCFYGYAARLYGYQIAGLSALWRLFRGKKWNPLRQRVDSYMYDALQLCVGTLFFTVLTFLLPTVMAYYIVFTTLRVAVLTVQGIITRTIDILSIFPAYVIILRACNSKLTTGDVYFSVLQEQKVLVLNMELVQIPFKTVIGRTLPEDVTKQEPLSWGAFWNSLVWGKIIYPI